MRVSREKAAQNRDRILMEAARLFREHGLSGVGVDALTDAAGLTHGSVYSQFGSKERLAAEAFGHAGPLEDYIGRYLSPDHRDQRGDGCVMAARAGELPRQGADIRHRFTDAVRAVTTRISRLLPGRRVSEDDALNVVATMVGALILARAVDDPDLSDRILAANRIAIMGRT